uniref:Uncharacterized protein n=1 Tax=Arundo donax TaxID=35708 RepID=A0A0A9AP42_ARUDO
MQVEERHLFIDRRIALEAVNTVKKDPVVGNIPGVQVGDEF